MSRRRCVSRIALLVALPVALLAGARLAAQAPADEAQIKAAFVYNFLKFVDWPADAFRNPQDSFVVAIVGDGDTADATEHFLTAKQLGTRPILVRRIKWDQSLSGVLAVFVAERDSKHVRHVLEAAAAGSVLSIGEGEDFASHGGIIGLLIADRRVRFDIDTDAAQTAGLKVSSKLLALTRIVHSSAGRTGGRP
ncbi:MAG: YfiR family protein [bacterium]